MEILQIIIALCIIKSNLATVPVPLFIIDADYTTEQDSIKKSLRTNPFSAFNPTDFVAMLKDLKHKSGTVVIFVERNFSSEDVSKRDMQGSPFINLKQILSENKLKYVPSVKHPFKALTDVFTPDRFNTFYLHNESSKLSLYEGLKYFYVYFIDDPRGTRQEKLRRHDQIIHHVLERTKQTLTSPVIAFYTGVTNPVVVKDVKTEWRKEFNDLSVTVASNGGLFRIVGISETAIANYRRTSMMLRQKPSIAKEIRDDDKMLTTLSYADFELQFNFTFSKDHWVLESVSLLEAGEEVGRTTLGFRAPWKHSFICAEPLKIANTRDGSIITISRYQIQPFRRTRKADQPEVMRRDDDEGGGDEGGDEAPPEEGGGGGDADAGSPGDGFGDGVDCCPYFSHVILSSLITVFIVLGTLFVGVIGAMNCHANDKYDDNQSGKAWQQAQVH